MQIPQALVEDLLGRWPIARLGTIGGAGRPHLVPIVFARTAEALLWSPVDGKPKSGRELARVRNVTAEPQVSLLLDDYAEDWSRLWWLRVDATARVIRPADPGSDPAVAAALEALRAKYPQYASVPMLPAPPTLLEITPVEIQSWCAGEGALPFSGAR